MSPLRFPYSVCRTVGVWLALVLAPGASAQAPSAWADLQSQDGIAYLLRTSPSEVMRYDLAAEAWLPPVPLAETPLAFAVDAGKFFVASAGKVERFDLDGSNKVHVATTPSAVTQLLVDGDLLFARRHEHIDSIHKGTFAPLDSHAEVYLGAAAVAPGGGALIYRHSSGIFPEDIFRVAYEADGRFGMQFDSPYHGEYPAGREVFAFPVGAKVADTSGTVYHASDLTHAGSLGEEIDDLAFHGDLPVALQGNKLISFDNVLRRVGDYTLENTSRKLEIHGGKVFAFHDDGTLPGGVGVQIVPLAALSLPAPGVAVSPRGLAYDITSTALDKRGVLHLLSKTHNSIFRWDVATQDYLATIPLPEGADELEYNETLDRLYVYAPSLQVYRVDLADPQPVAVPHMRAPRTVLGMISLDSDLALLYGGDDAHWDWLYDAAGGLISPGLACCFGPFHLFDQPRRRLFYGDAHRQYLGAGQFGATVGQPYSSGDRGRALAVSPDGEYMVDSLGFVYATDTMAPAGTLGNEVLSPVWEDTGTLYTLERPGSKQDPMAPDLILVQKWTGSLALDRSASILGRAESLHAIFGLKLVVTSVEGTPTFTVLDDELTIVPPATLSAPPLTATRFSATAGVLRWGDVQGESRFVIQRRIGVDGAWEPLHTVSTGVTTRVDAPLAEGFVYHYRVRAENGSLVSDWSNVAQVDLKTDPVVRLDPRTIDFTPTDVFLGIDNRLYIFSAAKRSIFVWDVVSRDWQPTIPLIGEPTHVAYSPAHHAILTGYDDGMVNRISAGSAGPAEAPFLQLPFRVCSLAAAGPVHFTGECEGSFWADVRSFDDAGNPLAWDDTRHTVYGAAWSDTRQAFYHYSSTRLMRTPVGATGVIGASVQGAYLGTSWLPIRLSPDESRVYLGAGQVVDAETLQVLQPSMPGIFRDIAWRGDQLLSASGTQITEHDPVTHAATASVTLPRTVDRIIPSPTGWIVVTTSSTKTFISVLSDELTPLSGLFTDGFE